MSNPPKGRDHNAALIDPYGIYGTRTAHRLRNMRRRQRAQQFILVLIVLGLIILGIYSRQTHIIPTVKASASWPLLISPSATPAWDPQYQNLLIPTKDGQIVATWPLARPVHSRILLETDFPIHNTPVIGEKYFYVGSESGILYALDRGTGKLIWQYDSGASITTQPQLLGSEIFCGNDAGQLMALRATSGKLIWKRKLPSPIGNGLATTTNPSKMVIVPLAGSAAQRGGVWAFDANNGQLKWKFPGNNTINTEQVTPPLTASINGKTRIFCANDTGALINLNAANGKYGGNDDGWKIYFRYHKDPNSLLLMRHSPLLSPQTSPTQLYVAGNDNIVRCVDVYNGRTLWTWASPAPINGNLQLAKGQLLVPCRGSISYLLHVDSGKIAEKLASATSDSFAAMLSIDNNIWALDNNGTLQQFTLVNP